LQGLLLQVDEAEIVAHEADDPNAFVDFFDSQVLASKDRRDVDAFSMHTDSAACGVEDVSVGDRRDRVGVEFATAIVGP
jgi:uncharacterized protein YbbK (DUF523 family)